MELSGESTSESLDVMLLFDLLEIGVCSFLGFSSCIVGKFLVVSTWSVVLGLGFLSLASRDSVIASAVSSTGGGVSDAPVTKILST